MKVIALTKVWYGGKEWLPGAEFEYPDGADLRAAIAVGKVKLADEQQAEYKEEGT